MNMQTAPEHDARRRQPSRSHSRGGSPGRPLHAGRHLHRDLPSTTRRHRRRRGAGHLRLPGRVLRLRRLRVRPRRGAGADRSAPQAGHRQEEVEHRPHEAAIPRGRGVVDARPDQAGMQLVGRVGDDPRIRLPGRRVRVPRLPRQPGRRLRLARRPPLPGPPVPQPGAARRPRLRPSPGSPGAGACDRCSGSGSIATNGAVVAASVIGADMPTPSRPAEVSGDVELVALVITARNSPGRPRRHR